MVEVRRCRLAIALLLLVTLPLAGCAGNNALQRAFSTDPNSAQWGNNSGRPTPQIQLPAGFPTELRYENATLLSVNESPANLPLTTPTSTDTSTWQQTRWQTPDPINSVKDFYTQQLQRDGWQLQPSTAEASPEELIGRKQNLQAIVSFPINSSPATGTEFELSYAQTAASTSISAAATGQNQPQPGDPNFIGPVMPDGMAVNSSSAAVATPQTFTDLATAPAVLQSNLQDMARLGVLTSNSPNSSLFNPNQPILRRTFARWLVTTNNRLYRDRPAQQIRLATPSDTAVFRDVPATDPDFPYIQGLAEAGYLPSSLSGDATALNFQPNVPLNRETMLRWKVPVDLRQSLPTATAETVRQTWGFKDASRIAPEALQAVLADHQNGDLSNIRRLFGATLLLQPKKPVSRAEAAAVLWYIGVQGDGFSALDVYKNEQQPLGQSPAASPPLAN